MYIKRSRFLTILLTIVLLLNIHYNNVDTPTKCTIVGECTTEAGLFAFVSLESRKKVITSQFSHVRSFFDHWIVRAMSFASCVPMCVNTYARECVTHRSDDWTAESTRIEHICDREYLRANFDDADAKPIAV